MPEAINTLAVTSLKFWHPERSIDDPAAGFLDEIIASLHILTSLMNVKMLYWPGDQFVAYPKGLLDRLAEAGVTLQSLDLHFPAKRKSGDSFRHHAEMSRKKRVLNEIKAFVVESG